MKYLYIVLLLLLIYQTQAATIYGTVYDLSLSKVNNVIVEINTLPQQRFVAANATYRFEVSKGEYRITTTFYDKTVQLRATENITIVDDGIYVLDLFLYPSFDDEIYSDLNFDITYPYETKPRFPYTAILVIIASALLLYLLYIQIKPKSVQLSNEYGSDKILTLLKNNQGRMTQKEIRKEIPLSEAKISLMIAELEASNKIKKIKKGRTNIIVMR